MKTIVSVLLFALLSTAAYAGGTPAPGVMQSGAVTANNCVKWVGNNLVTDAGSTCGGSGGSVSITSLSPGLVVSPSPLTGTGTISESWLISSNCGTATSCTISAASDLGKIVENNNASSIAVTLPQCGSGSFATGSSFTEINIGAGVTTITASAGSIKGSPTSSTTLALTQNQGVSLACDAGGNWNAFLGAGSGGGGSVTFPASGSVVVSNGTSSPAGVAEVDGNCLVGTSGAWAAGSCSGTTSSNLGASSAATSPQISGDATSGFYTSGAAKVDVAISNNKIGEWGTAGYSNTGTITGTSSSASALAIGLNGATNPAFTVDDSTALQVAGIAVKGAATGGTVTILATDSGANAALNVLAKGSSNGSFGTAGTGQARLLVNSSSIVAAAAAQVLLTPGANSGATNVRVSYTPAADVTLTASTNAPLVSYLGAGVVRQHSTGADALQTDYNFFGTTDSFVGASTLTDSGTINFTLKGCGTNATCTNATGIYHGSAALTGTPANSYPLNIAADTGGTNNYSGRLVGTLKLEASAALPVVSSCASGTLTIGSGDNKGSITGITAATACTLTFGVPLSAAPACAFSNSAGTSVGISAISTTAVTTSMTALTGSLYYICF